MGGEDAPDLTEWQYGRQEKTNYEGETQEEIKDRAFYKKMRLYCKIMGWQFLNKGVGSQRKIKIVKPTDDKQDS